MTESTFRVNGRLAKLADVAHALTEGFYTQSRDGHVSPTMLGINREGKLMVRHLRCKGEEIDTKREAAFEDMLKGQFIAALFFCEAWSITVDAREPRPDEPRDDPRRLEVVVFDGRDVDGNLLKGRALVNREEGDALMPIKYTAPDLTSYAPSIGSHT